MLAALALAAAVQAAPVLPAEPRRDLVVVVEGVRGDAGLVRVDLCAQDSFLTDRCAASGSARAQEGVVTVTLPDVPAGEYAIQAWHDRNGDGQVNRNLLGIPTEELGFSRAPPMGLHGPNFLKAAFSHGAAPQTVTVRLRRLP